MAEQVQIDSLRRATSIPFGEPYTDTFLSDLLDSQGFNGAAATIWREKAAAYAGMVDVSESGSSRKMSQLAENAMTMAKYYESLVASEQVTFTGAYTVPIERV